MICPYFKSRFKNITFILEVLSLRLLHEQTLSNIFINFWACSKVFGKRTTSFASCKNMIITLSMKNSSMPSYFSKLLTICFNLSMHKPKRVGEWCSHMHMTYHFLIYSRNWKDMFNWYLKILIGHFQNNFFHLHWKSDNMVNVVIGFS